MSFPIGFAVAPLNSLSYAHGVAMLTLHHLKAMDTHSLLEGLSDQLADRLLNHPANAWRTYDVGDWLVRQGTPCRSLTLLQEGAVAATMTNADGKEVTIERLEAPELLAPAFLFGSENRFPVNLRALTASRVCLISKERFMDLMHEEPAVMKWFITQISDRSVFLSRKLNEFALQNLRDRIVSYLQRYGKIDNQQKAASNLGVARPSLARMLAEMVKENIVIREGGAIILCKPV